MWWNFLKLDGLKVQKLTKSQIFRKSSYFGGKCEKIPPKYVFLAFSKNLIHLCLFLPPKMILQCSLWFCKNPMSGKYLVLQVWSKMLSASSPWSSMFWKESSYLLDFLDGDNYQRKVASETTTFVWVWPVVPLRPIR